MPAMRTKPPAGIARIAYSVSPTVREYSLGPNPIGEFLDLDARELAHREVSELVDGDHRDQHQDERARVDQELGHRAGTAPAVFARTKPRAHASAVEHPLERGCVTVVERSQCSADQGHDLVESALSRR